MNLEKKRMYWQKTISLDEGEKLEFKSTFLSPVPDAAQNRIIRELEKQLKKTSDSLKIQKISARIKELKENNSSKKNIQKKIMHSALKTICAFANTKGGSLLLGVSDDKKIYGLEQDYVFLKNPDDRDEFGKFFDAAIKEYFGHSFSSTLLEKEFLKFPEGDILIVTVRPSSEEIFLLRDELGEKRENLYVRNLSSSEKLQGVELAKFVKSKFRNQLIENTAVS